MEPVGIKQIDLVGKVAQRRKAGRIPRDIKCRPNAFFLIEYDLGARQFRFSVSAAGKLFQAVASLILLAFFQGLEGALLRRKQKFGQTLVPQRGVNEKDDKGGESCNCDINEPSQALPACALRVVKDRFGHG